MKKIARIAHTADAFCARLNDGLTAVAVALALLTAAAIVERLPMVLMQAADVGIGAYDP